MTSSGAGMTRRWAKTCPVTFTARTDSARTGSGR